MYWSVVLILNAMLVYGRIVNCIRLSEMVHLTLTSFSWFIGQCLVFLVKSVSYKLSNMLTIFSVLNDCKL